MRAAWPILLVFAGCLHARPDLGLGEAHLQAGRVREALATFDAVAARPGAAPEERVRALTDGALACERLGDHPGAQARLERAIEPEVPGASEPALFYLAEELRTTQPARALNLYYRAAAGAREHRGGGFPYHDASERILQLSMSR